MMLDSDIPDPGPLQDQLAGRLERLHRLVCKQLVVEGLAHTLAVSLAVGLVSFGLDRWLSLGLAVRLAMLATGVGVLLVVGWRVLLRPVRSRLGPIDLAAAVDRAAAGTPDRPEIAPRVASVLQLPELLAGRQRPSKAMVHLAVARSYDALRGVDFARVLDRRRAGLNLAALAAVLALPVALALAAPETAGLWFERWFLASHRRWPQQTYLRVAGLADGRIVVPRGEPYVLRVSAAGDSAVPESIRLRYTGQDGQSTSTAMTAFGPNDFRHSFASLQSPGRVTLRGGDDRLGPFTIEPVDRPRIISLDLTAKHPTDAAARTHTFSGRDAAPAYLPKTQMELCFCANVPIDRANVRLTDGPVPEPRRLDERKFAMNWVHERPVQMVIELVGRRVGLASRPLPVAIGLKRDRAPRVSLRCSGVRQFITPHATVPLTVTGRDDYGICALELAIKVEPPASAGAGKARDETLTLAGPVGPPKQKQLEKEHRLAVSDLSPPTGSLIYLTGQARDARYLGAQTGTSPTRAFRVVEAVELFRQILLRLQTERSRFRKALGRADEIRDELNSAATMDAAALLRKHRLLQSQVWRISRAMVDSVTEMRLNALGSPEVYDLLQRRVLDPLATLHDDLLSEQRRDLEKLSQAEDAALKSEAAARQRRIAESMRDLLRAMAQWDSFVDVLNQVDEVIKLQTGVRRATEELRLEEVQSIFDE